jgi:phosphoribosylformylglycinamidine (FGAM) synthase-like amidotransferase family enzyme
MHRIRLTHRSLGNVDLADWSGIILGGGPYNVSDAFDSKSETQRRAESELLPLIGRIVDHDFPFLGCCYGVGASGLSSVLRRPHLPRARRCPDRQPHRRGPPRSAVRGSSRRVRGVRRP